MKRLRHPANLMIFKLIILVFVSILISNIFVGAISILLIKSLDLENTFALYPMFFIAFPLTASGLISLFLSVLTSKSTLTELNTFLNAIEKVGEGDFNVTLDVDESKVMHQIYIAFNKMVKELDSIRILSNDFISSFSHEFKTPIVSIKGFAKLAKDPKISTKERDEYLNIIIAEINRLVSLSNHTLLLTQLETQEFVLEKESFNLDEQIRECIVLLQNDWEEKNINLKINLEKVLFYGNKHLLQQLWLNILSNAIKFSNDFGNISISLTQTDNICINITDDGLGMAEDTLKFIFDKFYQEDSSRKVEGLGLGLSIAKRIVDLCKGEIDVTSKLNEGSSFLITLPKKEY